MESLGDILKRLQHQNTFANTGYPDSSTVVPVEEGEVACDICGGTGWVRIDAPVGHANFGKARPCACQKEATEEERLGRLQRFSNMGPLIDQTFDTVTPDGRTSDSAARHMLQSALEKTRAYAEEPHGWLVLTGYSGCGKTMLAAAAANRCMEKGLKVFFINVPDLLDHLRASFAPASELTYDELFEQVKNVPVLVLDDMGAHSSTSWANEKLYQVLNYRFNLALPTIVVLGMPIDNVEERVCTRLEDSRLSQVVPVAPSAPAVEELGPLDPEMLKRMTFDAFNARGNRANPRQRQSLEQALKAAKIFAKDPHRWLLLVGDSGCGKTHLAVAVAGERLKAGDTPKFWPVPGLLDHLRYTFNPESHVTYDKVFEGVKRCPLLILDDLGAETSTPWANEKLYQLIVHRHNAELPTIITLSARELDKPGTTGTGRDPIASRLNDSRLVMTVEIDAPDYRNQARSVPTSPPHRLRPR